MSELPPRGHVSARKRFLAERGNFGWIMSMVAVAAVVIAIVLVLMHRERSKTAGDRSERLADSPVPPAAPNPSTPEAAPPTPNR
jgi:hypothetical protein